MHPFFRPRRVACAAQAATPYQRAAQVWDERMGLSLAHARNWRRLAFANLALAAFLGAGWWVQAERAVVKPFVVEVADWGQTQKITAVVGREAVAVDVLNVVRRTERTYDLQWRETRFVNGQQASAERWRALITIQVRPPKTEAELMKNPLGIRIEDVSWTPDAS